MTAILPAVCEGEVRFSPGRLRSSTTSTYFLKSQGLFLKSPLPEYCPMQDSGSLSTSSSSTVLSSPEFAHPSLDRSSYTPTTVSSLSLNADEEELDGILLPSYDADDFSNQEYDSDYYNTADPDPSVDESPTDTLPLHRLDDPFAITPRPVGDDSLIEEQPSRHVDYLSHDWKEEDIWASWRYVTTRRNMYSNSVRLENASWRTWAKLKYKLRTVSPETLNWLKDCDVTWLYGPLQTESKHPAVSNTSPPPSGLSSSNSFLDRKPILKKKTASETILRRSLTQHTLLKHAGAILKAKEAQHACGRPYLERAISDFAVPRTRRLVPSACGSTISIPTCTSSSGLDSPTEKRHIHFNNEVVQCIAVEAKEEDDPYRFDSDDDSDGSVVMMKQFAAKPSISSRCSPTCSNFSGESKTIAPLPSTTLKYRGDTPEPPVEQKGLYSSWFSASKLSPSPSVETLRPPRPEANFLLDDDDDRDAMDLNWQPKHAGYDLALDRPWFVNPDDDEELERGADLRLTSSGMFMPYEDAESSHPGLFGRVLDTVNTARDIAHVIWNVGWRR